MSRIDANSPITSMPNVYGIWKSVVLVTCPSAPPSKRTLTSIVVGHS